MQLALPDPPIPGAALYVWLRGDSQGRATTVKAPAVPIPTTTTLLSSLNPALASQDVTFIANVDPPPATGTITFMQGQTALGTAPLNGGQASFTTSRLAAGELSITAIYSGDPPYAGSTSSALKQTVQ